MSCTDEKVKRDNNSQFLLYALYEKSSFSLDLLTKKWVSDESVPLLLI